MTRLLALVALACCAADWPVFRGTPAMQGTGTAALPDQLAEVWAFQCQDAVEGAPAVVGNVVYVASMDRNLYALDLATGTLKWKVKLGSMKAAPAVHAGRVVVGDLEGKVHGVDAATGKVVWAFETNGEVHAGANFVGDDVLIGSHDATLYRLDPAGKKVWEYKIDGPVNGSAAVAGENTFVAGCDSQLHVVAVATGQPVGKIDLGGQAGATAAIYGDYAYVGTMGNAVLAVDWKKLAKGWEFAAKRRQQPFYGSAAVTDKLVIVGSRDKKVYALDRATGTEVWSVAADGAVDASPVVVGGRVYVGSLGTTGEFYILDLATGRVVQQLSLDSPVGSSAAVTADALIVGTDKGRVVKLGAKK